MREDNESTCPDFMNDYTSNAKNEITNFNEETFFAGDNL